MMLKGALTFALIAIVASDLGCGGVAAGAAGISPFLLLMLLLMLMLMLIGVFSSSAWVFRATAH